MTNTTAKTLILSALPLFLLPFNAEAQIAEDGTTSTTVTPTTEGVQIDNGDRSGGNLFHSFQDFSVPTNTEAYFNNANDVANIFSRVTGSEISNIDGLIRANGTANLFLMNPNGIVFGENASLNIGGSFFATTADSILFEDNVAFSASDPTTPLLTSSIPIGANFRDNPANIINRSVATRSSNPIPDLSDILDIPDIEDSSNISDIGNISDNIDTGNISDTPDILNNPVGLQVNSGKTIALVGGNILIEGGIISAPEGRIELGSVIDEGKVDLNLSNAGLTLSYNEQQFGDVLLSQSASLKAGDFLSFTNSGDIHIQAEKVRLSEESQIISESFLSSEIGTISIQSSELEIIDNSRLGGSGSQQTKAGNIDIKTAKLTIQESTIDADSSGISGSNISINAPRLFLDKSNIFAGNSSSGTGGNIEIIATDSVKLIRRSQIDTRSINTTQVSSSNQGMGQGGNIEIETDTLELQDTSGISSSVLTGGEGGELNIIADRVIVNQNSELSVKAPLKGNGGNLEIQANTIEQDNGNITVSSIDGISGNIKILTNSLTLNRESSISSETETGTAAG